jgi:hypothetical protein
MKKLFVLLAIVLLINGCEKDSENDPINEGLENNLTYTDGTINIEGVTGLDNSSISVQSIDNSSQVNADGSFEVNQEPSDDEKLPLLFLKDGEIIFGYYQEADNDNTISIDDILIFYFTVHPEVAIQGLQNPELLSKIKSSSNYEELKNLVLISLDSNTSPFKNSTFMELLDESGYSIVNSLVSKPSKVKEADIFKFTQTRDGKISWPKKFPLFAYVGMEITNAQGIKSGPHIFDKPGLVGSPGSIVEWVYNHLKETNFPTPESSFQFSEEGEYTITFTNGIDGIGTNELEDKVDFTNRLNLGIDIVSYAFPIGVKTILKGECKKSLIDFFASISLDELAGKFGNKFQLEEYMKKLHNDIYETVKGCSLANFTYMDKIKALSKYFNYVEDGMEIMLFIRDYIISDISGTEKRFYYDGYSFGGLTYTNISAEDGISSKTEFSGAPGSDYSFKATIGEDTFEYAIESDFTIQSTIEQKPIQGAGNGLPFTPTITGDATISENSTWFTDSAGLLSTTMTIGEEDSEFKIDPSFKNSGINSELITLKTEKFIYEGNWLLKTFLDNTPPVYGDDFWLYWENKYEFDSNGNAPNSTWWSDFAGSTGWLISNNSWTLIYNESNSTLQLRNNYWSVSNYFTVQSVDDTVFYSFGGYPEQKFELYRQ